MEWPDARYHWVLDPIDGTKAFISNCFIFGSLLSLLRDGRPILGGNPTLLGDRPVRVRPAPKLEEATVLPTGHWEMVKPAASRSQPSWEVPSPHSRALARQYGRSTNHPVRTDMARLLRSHAQPPRRAATIPRNAHLAQRLDGYRL